MGNREAQHKSYNPLVDQQCRYWTHWKLAVEEIPLEQNERRRCLRQEKTIASEKKSATRQIRGR